MSTKWVFVLTGIFWELGETVFWSFHFMALSVIASPGHATRVVQNKASLKDLSSQKLLIVEVGGYLTSALPELQST